MYFYIILYFFFSIILYFCGVQEELAEGLHLIDFEQLKIENQTYNEKIEERNEVSIDAFKIGINPVCKIYTSSRTKAAFHLLELAGRTVLSVNGTGQF